MVLTLILYMKNVSVDVRAPQMFSVGSWRPYLSLSVHSVVGVVFAVSSMPGPVKLFTEMSSLKFLNQAGQLSPGFMAMLGRDRPLRTE